MFNFFLLCVIIMFIIIIRRVKHRDTYTCWSAKLGTSLQVALLHDTGRVYSRAARLLAYPIAKNETHAPIRNFSQILRILTLRIL